MPLVEVAEASTCTVLPDWTSLNAPVVVEVTEVTEPVVTVWVPDLVETVMVLPSLAVTSPARKGPEFWLPDAGLELVEEEPALVEVELGAGTMARAVAVRLPSEARAPLASIQVSGVAAEIEESEVSVYLVSSPTSTVTVVPPDSTTVKELVPTVPTVPEISRPGRGPEGSGAARSPPASDVAVEDEGPPVA